MNKQQLNEEIKYWGDCTNTHKEEEKHYVYGRLMGLKLNGDSFKLDDTKVLDMGGGPVSLLLKCKGISKGRVVDPIDYPDWTKDRYKSRGIDVSVSNAEDMDYQGYDEVWIYNMLGLVEDRELLIQKAWAAAPKIRVFEWVSDGLTKNELEGLFGGEGKFVDLKQQGCFGHAFYGVFERMEE